MRRHVVRLALALVATSVLTACADLSTGPEAPRDVRLDGSYGSGTDTLTTRVCGNHQGGSTCP